MTDRCRHCNTSIDLQSTAQRIVDEMGRPIRSNIYLCGNCWDESLKGFAEMKADYQRLVDSGFSDVDASKLMCQRIDERSERESLVECDNEDGVLMADNYRGANNE